MYAALGHIWQIVVSVYLLYVLVGLINQHLKGHL
jgi:hypothetical protein